MPKLPQLLLSPPSWQPIITDKDIPRLLRSFAKFLGPGELANKLKAVERAIETSRPRPIYTSYWVQPANWLWLAIQQAQRLQNLDARLPAPVTPEIHRALEFAKMIQLLHHDMPPWKRDEVRRRLLGGDELVTSVQIELMTVLHYQMVGCKVTWIKPLNDSRTCDMLVRCGSFEFEVECKAKSIDAGRTIERRRFYYFCDSVAPMILTKQLIGVVEIVLPRRFPSDTRQLLEAVKIAIDGGNASCSDGTTISMQLVPDSKEEANVKVESEIAEKLRGLFGHAALTFPPGALNRPCKPLTIVCRSLRDDDLMAAVAGDLKDASDQLSGTRPGSIVCYIPELGAFEGLYDPKAAIAQMTARFFQRAGAAQVFSVEYVTDPQVSAQSYGLRSEVRTLRYRNPHYASLASDPASASALMIDK